MRAIAGQDMALTFRNEDDTGILTNTDSLPTAVLYVNGAIDSAITITITNISTGTYKAAFTMGDYSDGDIWELVVTAVIDGITYSRIVKEGYIEALPEAIEAESPLVMLYVFVGQANTVSFYVPGYDLDSMSIDFVIGQATVSDSSPRIFGVSDVVISNSSISRADGLVSLTIPSSLTGSRRFYPWYLRNNADYKELSRGWISVIIPA